MSVDFAAVLEQRRVAAEWAQQIADSEAAEVAEYSLAVASAELIATEKARVVRESVPELASSGASDVFLAQVYDQAERAKHARLKKHVAPWTDPAALHIDKAVRAARKRQEEKDASDAKWAAIMNAPPKLYPVHFVAAGGTWGASWGWEQRSTNNGGEEQ